MHGFMCFNCIFAHFIFLCTCILFTYVDKAATTSIEYYIYKLRLHLSNLSVIYTVEKYFNKTSNLANGWINERSFNNTTQAPVPLSIFRSNSKFDENSKHFSVKYTRPITTIFCTCHVTVVTSAKYRCDRSSVFETRAFWIFIEFRIRSKYA